MRARSIAVVLILLALFALSPALSIAPMAPAPAFAAPPSQLPRFTFVADKGGSILVHGTYPKVSTHCVRRVQPVLHARFQRTRPGALLGQCLLQRGHAGA